MLFVVVCACLLCALGVVHFWFWSYQILSLKLLFVPFRCILAFQSFYMNTSKEMFERIKANGGDMDILEKLAFLENIWS